MRLGQGQEEEVAVGPHGEFQASCCNQLAAAHWRTRSISEGVEDTVGQ